MNHYHVLVGLYKPEINVCQMWPFELRECITKVSDRRKNEVTQAIVEIVADELGILCELIYSKSRKREVVEARHIIIYFIKKYTRMTLSSIGHVFALTDHTSVLHAIKSVENRNHTEEDYSHSLTQLETKIKYKL